MSETLSGWKAKSLHTITLPSGMEVDIRLPNVAKMVVAAEFPNALRDIALAELQGVERGTLDVEQLAAAMQFNRYVVTQTVVNPALSEDDLDALPQEDISALEALARREVSVEDYKFASKKAAEAPAQA